MDTGEKNKKFLELVNAELEKRLEKFSAELAQDYYDLLIENIKINKFGFTLKEATLLIRQRIGIASTLPLIETEEYLKNIIIKDNFVTVNKGTHSRRPYNKNSRALTYEHLAWILEFGRKDKKIPGFPVWRKTKEEFEKLREKKADKLFQDTVKYCKNKIL